MKRNILMNSKRILVSLMDYRFNQYHHLKSLEILCANGHGAFAFKSNGLLANSPVNTAREKLRTKAIQENRNAVPVSNKGNTHSSVTYNNMYILAIVYK